MAVKSTTSEAGATTSAAGRARRLRFSTYLGICDHNMRPAPGKQSRVDGDEFTFSISHFFFIIPYMLELNLPGRGLLKLEHLVLDVNGTLAKDGQLLDHIPSLLLALQNRLTVHLLTADTHGRQGIIDQQLGLRATRLRSGQEAEQKSDYVRALGAEKVIAIGQGANDAGMLKAAALGMAVLSEEGLAIEALLNADVLANSIYDAFSLLEFPARLVATLRK